MINFLSVALLFLPPFVRMAAGQSIPINTTTTSSASITRNQNDGASLAQYGILNTGEQNGSASNSLLCSNTIAYCSTSASAGAGISTLFWSGVAELNDVSNCDVGHLSTSDPFDARVLWSHYYLNALSGLRLTNGDSHLDLSGFHIASSNVDLAAFNVIDRNNPSHSTSHAQIETSSPFLKLGTDDASKTPYSTHGGNNVISFSSGGTKDKLVTATNTNTKVGLDKNFWGTDDGSAVTSEDLSTTTLLNNVDQGSDPKQKNTQFSNPTTPICTDGMEPNNDKSRSNGPKPMTISDQDTSAPPTCQHLADVGYDYAGSSLPASKLKGYDTLKLFVENCATIQSVIDWGPPRGAFSAMTGCVQQMDTTNARWLEYREWLKKVLYLSPDSLYYCADVSAMLSTFQYLVPGHGKDYNGVVAIDDYLIQTNRCPEMTKSLLDARAYTRSQQYEIWHDTVYDPSKGGPDTSAVSIDSIGFSILRGPEFGAVLPGNGHYASGVGELVASKNPFDDATTLETTLGDASMLRLEVFDVLGKQVYAENQFFSAGDVRWRLDGKSLPEGSLYARISTIGGAVRTIKLIRGE